MRWRCWLVLLGLGKGRQGGSSDFRFPHTTSRSSQHLDEGLSSWLLRPKARFDLLKLFVVFVIAVSSRLACFVQEGTDGAKCAGT